MHPTLSGTCYRRWLAQVLFDWRKCAGQVVYSLAAATCPYIQHSGEAQASPA